MRMILRGGLVVTMDGGRRMLDPGTVVIEDQVIVEVSQREISGGAGDTIIDCRGKMVLPGLVNVHAHTTEVLFRGCATDLPFLEWLFERNHPLMERMTEDDAYAAGLLCGLEMLSSGTTCYLDPEVWPGQFAAVARAVERVGLRAGLALAMEGRTGYSAGDDLQLMGAGPADDLAQARSWHRGAGGRLRVWLGPRVLSAVDEPLARFVRATATELRTGITLHFAEVPEDVEQIRDKHGVLPTAYLEGLGLMGPDVVLTHAICLEPEDMACIARTGTRIAHCPSSNLKLGNGFAPIPALVAQGVVVGLGTDGGMCNDTSDMLREMALTALIHKGSARDPHVLPAEKMLAMVTCEGARVLGQDGEIGSLVAGKRADITAIDMRRVGWRPLHNPIANMVYGSATRDGVDTVIVDGELLLQEGQPTHLDAAAILREAQARSEALIEAAGLSTVVRSAWQAPGVNAR